MCQNYCQLHKIHVSNHPRKLYDITHMLIYFVCFVCFISIYIYSDRSHDFCGWLDTCILCN